MKRGRPATRGIDTAFGIAQKRGCVMRVVNTPESVCDFFIRTVMLIIFVRVVRIEKIVAPVREIEHQCRGTIAELRLFPPSPQIRLELWVYSKHGTYRFFRLTEAGLEEIPQSGEPGSAVTAGGESGTADGPVTPKVEGKEAGESDEGRISPPVEVLMGEGGSPPPRTGNSPSENSPAGKGGGD